MNDKCTKTESNHTSETTTSNKQNVKLKKKLSIEFNLDFNRSDNKSEPSLSENDEMAENMDDCESVDLKQDEGLGSSQNGANSHELNTNGAVDSSEVPEDGEKTSVTSGGVEETFGPRIDTSNSYDELIVSVPIPTLINKNSFALMLGY